jgi:asparagine synthase (glutamine-hydrolysing)
VPLYYVSKLARSTGTIVVQVGEGSDEIFAGYDWFGTYLRIQERFWRHAERTPPFARRAAAALAQPLVQKTLKKRMASELVRRMGANESLFWGGAVVFDETIKPKLFSSEMRAQYNGLSTHEVVRRYQDTIAKARPRSDYAARMTYLELKLRLPELLLMRVDKITMATSVEARVPFLDHHLIEYAMSLPRTLKVKGGTGKHILKRALESVLPADVLYKPKRGFGAPVREWFRGPEGESLIGQLMNSSIRERNFFDYAFIQRLVDEHRRETRDWSANLWCLLNLSLWYDRWIA